MKLLNLIYDKVADFGTAFISRSVGESERIFLNFMVQEKTRNPIIQGEDFELIKLGEIAEFKNEHQDQILSGEAFFSVDIDKNSKGDYERYEHRLMNGSEALEKLRIMAEKDEKNENLKQKGA